MLTSQKVIDAINEQIGYEFSAELTRRDPCDRRAEIEVQDSARRGETVARPGNSCHPANQRAGGACPEKERLYHDQFSAVVPDRAARGSFVDGQSAQDHRAGRDGFVASG